MYPDYDNNNYYGQFNNPDLNGVYAETYEQQVAGVNCFDTRDTAAQKVLASRTNSNPLFAPPTVELDIPQFKFPTFNTPIE